MHPINFSISSNSPEQTKFSGRILGQLSHPGILILLDGEMGVGKTTFVQGLLQGLDSEEIARSPTFIIITEYSSRIKLFHVDLYRITDEDKIYEIGLDDCINENDICVIEWPNKYPNLYELPHIKINIEHTKNQKRLITFSSTEKKFNQLLKKFSNKTKEKAI
ncbi:MAG: tRNA (adenosine(37)-N6)-threonylcarbamoyltransferase complex ATPase subunit type 1 TsaE [SAR202 cluster bacterium]|nr:tRNA (adenosine(37)-N6)-threonylcarbamoyltransferase complex ATPase subunit type 1 TsaE [SAR202 cluster bacterium]|tara:strand:+ start:59064 stop:59552 length:489 start_codon:yes stop_codon:yes gene_type:complete